LTILRISTIGAYFILALSFPMILLGKRRQAVSLLSLGIQAFSGALMLRLFRANLLQELDQPNQALADLDFVISRTAKDPFVPALLSRGRLRLELGDIDGAEHDFDWLARVSPETAAAYAGRGDVLRGRGEWIEALAAYDNAIERLDRLTETTRPWRHHAQWIELEATGRGALYDALTGRASCLSRLKLYDLAASDYTRILSLRNIPPQIRGWAMGRRAGLLLEQGRLADADALLTAALQVSPGDSELWVVKARVDNAVGDRESALHDVNRAIDLRPNDASQLGWRGYLHFEMQEWQQALADFSLALAIDPDSAWTLSNRGATLRILNRNDEALPDLDRAIHLEPGRAWALRQRGLVLHALGRFQEAIEDFDRSLDLDLHPGTLGDRGQSLLELEHLEAALADFTRAIELDSSYAWAFRRRADVFETLGRYEDALADYRHSLALEPSDVWVLSRCGSCLRELGRLEESLATLNEAAQRDPDDSWVLFSRALTYRALGRLREALADANRAVALDPEKSWFAELRDSIIEDSDSP
jgi:tetratricopeptide (TPR) repeat protein